jgi:hypothetical protein
LNLEEALKLPVFSSSRLLTAREVTGHRSISWVAVIEVPLQQFIRPREFVISTGMNVGQNIRRLSTFVKTIAGSGASALGLAVGPYTPRIPKQIVHIANRANLPLIELPWELRFSEISEAILKLLIREQSDLQSEFDFVRALASGTVTEEIAVLRAKKWSHDLRRPFVALFAKVKVTAAYSPAELQELLQSFNRHCRSAAQRNGLQWFGTVMENGFFGYLLLRSGREQAGSFLRTIPSLSTASLPVSWGIGSRGRGFPDFAKSYSEARTACEIGVCLHGVGSITDISEIPAERLLFAVRAQDDARALLARYVEPLLKMRRIPILQTLETLIENGYNASETARKLAINRRSLLYRLDKVQSSLGIDLRSADVRFAIALSLRLYRLEKARCPSPSG